MKKFALILSIILNIVLAGSIGIDAKQEPEVVEIPVEKIVEVPVEVEKIVEVEKVVEVPVEVEKEVVKTVEVEKGCKHRFAHDKNITGEYDVDINGEIIVDFSDYSWAIINHKEKEYVFQPACMGDWDMTFDTFKELKMAMTTYFEGANVEIQKPEKIKQTKETKILNPDKIPAIEKELAKIPDAVKRLLIANEVTIEIKEGHGEQMDSDSYTYGTYYWDENKIIMDAKNSSVEDALIHEIGHALDDIIGIETEKIWESYENQEIKYENEHFYSEIREYVAQGIHEYYNGTLEKNTTMYKELNAILGGIR